MTGLFARLARRLDGRTGTRLAFVALLLVPAAWVGASYATADVRHEVRAYHDSLAVPPGERAPVVGPRANVTVVAGLESPLSETKALYAFGPGGRLVYYDNRTVYGDVDPSPAGRRTVMVATHDYRGGGPCAGRCTTQRLTRVNLSTGVRRRLYAFATPGYRATNWHDADRVGPDRYLIGSIREDEVRLVNVSSGVREWGWSAQAAYPLDEGGPFPYDWTHLNDVERLPDGRVMVSLRNQDSVVFVHPGRGLQEEWTLGCEDCHDVLFEQHNPDYIPASRGGPAVLVADSENNRVVEYQRVDGEWERSWYWTDPAMQWPRDADRLPNGHTLITDSHANRVVEVDRAGRVVWQATVPNGYDAERLGTGDESAGGPSAVRAGLSSHGADRVAPERARSVADGAKWDWTRKAWHGLQFWLPSWVKLFDVLFAVEGLLAVLAWAYVEARWRGLRLRWPVVVRRD